MLVERNSSEICLLHPYLYPSASPFLPPVWVQPLSPSQIPQGEPAIPRSFCGKEQPATHSAAFSFLSQFLPGPGLGRAAAPRSPPGMQTSGSQIPRRGSRELQMVPSQRQTRLSPGSCLSELLRFSHTQPGACENVQALGRRMWVPIVFNWGNIFGLSKSLFPCL